MTGVNALNSGPWILVEDLSTVYNDVEVERGVLKHAHKKRKLADGREKTMVKADPRSFLIKQYLRSNYHSCAINVIVELR